MSLPTSLSLGYNSDAAIAQAIVNQNKNSLNFTPSTLGSEVVKTSLTAIPPKQSFLGSFTSTLQDVASTGLALAQTVNAFKSTVQPEVIKVQSASSPAPTTAGTSAPAMPSQTVVLGGGTTPASMGMSTNTMIAIGALALLAVIAIPMLMREK